jgi:hypothetical protein
MEINTGNYPTSNWSSLQPVPKQETEGPKMAFNDPSNSSLASATTPPAPETMNSTTTTPALAKGIPQDMSNDTREWIAIVLKQNRWREQQMSRMETKIDQQSRELAKKDQIISNLKEDNETSIRHFQREIDSQDEQLGEKTEAITNLEQSKNWTYDEMVKTREELGKMKCSRDWAQIANARARQDLEKEVAKSEETVQTLRETIQIMQDRLAAQQIQMKGRHGQEARIFKSEEKIRYLEIDSHLMNGEIKTLKKSTADHSFVICEHKRYIKMLYQEIFGLEDKVESLSTQLKEAKDESTKATADAEKLKTTINHQRDIITQQDDIIAEQEAINEKQHRDSVRSLRCAKSIISIQNATIEKQVKEDAQISLRTKNNTAMQDTAMEKQQKDQAPKLLHAENDIARLNATIDQQAKDEAQRARYSKNLFAKQDAFIKSQQVQIDDTSSMIESLLTEQQERTSETEEIRKTESKQKVKKMCLKTIIIAKKNAFIERGKQTISKFYKH